LNGVEGDMKSFGLSTEDAEVNNKSRKKIDEMLANPGSPG